MYGARDVLGFRADKFPKYMAGFTKQWQKSLPELSYCRVPGGSVRAWLAGPLLRSASTLSGCKLRHLSSCLSGLTPDDCSLL